VKFSVVIYQDNCARNNSTVITIRIHNIGFMVVDNAVEESVYSQFALEPISWANARWMSDEWVYVCMNVVLCFCRYGKEYELSG